MTSLAHTLVGASLGVLCWAPDARFRKRACQVLALALCANIPDFAIPGWGHDRYDISHSIFVGLAIGLVVAGVFYLLSNMRSRIGGWPVVLGGILAMLSHFLLDSFYNHGHGIAIFWPFSDARLALPISWLSTLKGSPPPMTLHTLKTYGIELVSYGPVFIVAVAVRHWLSRQRQEVERSGTSPLNTH